MGIVENSIRSKVSMLRAKVNEALAFIADVETGWREQVADKLNAAAAALEEASDAIVETPPEESESTDQPDPAAS